VLVWHARTSREPAASAPSLALPVPRLVVPPAPAPAPTTTRDTTDVSVELAAAATRETDDYAAATAELLQLARDARPRWNDDRKQAFDARVAELHKQIDGAAEGRPRQRAYSAMIRYLQGAIIRDDIALADTAFGGHR
jgi:hypothetical protein